MRYLPQTAKNRQAMLDFIGVKSVDDFYKAVPKEAFFEGKADLPDHIGEIEVEAKLRKLGKKNHAACDGGFFLGAGCYNHHIPATADHIIQRSEFLTAYTPYQPEIAQGTLMVIFQFQSMIARITGQEIANASMYDGATASAEAALMALRINKKRNKIVINDNLHPQYEEVIKTYIRNYGQVEVAHQGEPDEEAACYIVQTPGFCGTPYDLDQLRKKCDETGALLVVVVNEIVALGMLPAPSQADIVCGEARSIGVAMSYGGPHLGFFACKKQYVRQMPGRICGETIDEDGRRSYVLTLNTREQHIRRDKATSNICTNQGLCATAFTVHMALLGEGGFKRLAKLNHERACKLADSLEDVQGVELVNESFFNEFIVKLSKDSKEVVEALAKQKIIAGLALPDNQLLVAATELTTDEDIEEFKTALSEVLK